MSTKISAGDTVRLLTNGGYDDYLKVGDTAVVVRVSGSLVYLGSEELAFYSGSEVEKVEEDLAEWEKELLGIETKQEETPVKQALKVGDKVRLLSDGGFEDDLVAGDEATVTDVDGGLVNLSNGLSYFYNSKNGYPDEVEPVVAEKPKARSQEIEKHEIQKGDLLVCFWDNGGVETRKKGIAHEKYWDGDWMTSGGGFLTYSDEADGSVEHIYLLDRPEPKPEGFDALDKTKTYYLKHYQGELDWYLAFAESEWRYGDLGNIVTRAYTFEEQFTSGDSAWEKPVEYVEPPKTIQEKLDELGVKAGDTYTLTSWKGAVYQFLGGGNLRYSNTAQPNPWWTNRNVDESDLEQIVDGSFTKIS